MMKLKSKIVALWLTLSFLSASLKATPNYSSLTMIAVSNFTAGLLEAEATKKEVSLICAAYHH